jgi:hypothetical protein
MTPQLKLKLVRLEQGDNNTAVHWIVGVSDGTNVSGGIGMTEVTADLAGKTDEEILQIAINTSGGLALLDDLYARHVTMLQPVVEATLIDDWYVAYVFYSAAVGVIPDTKDIALANMLAGFGTYGVTYNHSIFNVTTGEHWSHTFAYGVAEEFDPVEDPDNQFGGTVYHIKVRDGAVAEWYKHYGALKHNGISVDWVALDLVSGTPIEYYQSVAGDIPSTTVMNKFDASTQTLATSTIHGAAGVLEIPAQFAQSLIASGFEHTDKIFGYATKSYGQIVEYTVR